jgi:5-methylcytosine-specific restriction endonuclease McrA
MDVLNRHVLMMNKNWVVIGTTNVKNAILLMSRGSARGLCMETYVPFYWDQWIAEADNMPETEYSIRTSSFSIPAPEVIILVKFDEVMRKSVKFSPKGIYRRDDYTCQYCAKKFKAADLSIDHVVPRSKGGPNTWLNCVAACFKCNQKKGDRSPKAAGLQLQRAPFKPTWNPVFHIRPDLRPDAWKDLIKGSW